MKSLAQYLASLNRILNAYGISYPSKIWERQYGQGKWQVLNDQSEVARYSVIGGLIKHFIQKGTMLDVGCGEGVLVEYLKQAKYKTYVGIDLSKVAIRQATKRLTKNTKLIAADAQEIVFKEKFDVIIFNESLYYFDNPWKLMTKYTSYLEKKGIFLTSFYTSNLLANLIWRRIKKKYKAISEVRLSVGHKNWVINIFQPTIEV